MQLAQLEVALANKGINPTRFARGVIPKTFDAPTNDQLSWDALGCGCQSTLPAGF